MFNRVLSRTVLFAAAAFSAAATPSAHAQIQNGSFETAGTGIGQLCDHWINFNNCYRESGGPFVRSIDGIVAECESASGRVKCRNPGRAGPGDHAASGVASSVTTRTGSAGSRSRRLASQSSGVVGSLGGQAST